MSLSSIRMPDGNIPPPPPDPHEMLKWPRGEIIRHDNKIDPNSLGNLKMLDGRLASTPLILILYP